jgi:NAD(P)-dependent dehydrogenase (short-subunit alcohol dehydrogenase family)
MKGLWRKELHMEPSNPEIPNLRGKVALVAGATRGAGRGIALALGAAGATVYCTGRSVRGRLSDMRRPETIDETAELVSASGGIGIPIQVDHNQMDEVRALFERVRREQNGQLDLLVNDIWGGDDLAEWGTSFWRLSLEKGLKMIERGLFTHIITSRFGAPLMVERGRGIIIEITDGDSPEYRGNLYYDLVKSSVIRLALGMAHELRDRGIAVVALTPGFLRSEAMLDHFGVAETNWQDAIEQDPYFAGSETPHFIGHAVAALAADPQIMQKSGQVLATWNLAEEYRFADADGTRPHWGRFFREFSDQQKE